MQGAAINEAIPGCAARRVRESDIDFCNRLCMSMHGHDHGSELRGGIKRGVAMVVERVRRIIGYATSVALFAHAVVKSDDDLNALIGAAKSFGSRGFLVPSRNGELMRWCRGSRLRATQPMTPMTMGLYIEPTGAYLPSVLYWLLRRRATTDCTHWNNWSGKMPASLACTGLGQE